MASVRGAAVVLLIGSMARGQFRAGSDIDLQLIVDAPVPPGETFEIGRFGPPINGRTTSILEVEGRLDRPDLEFARLNADDWLADRLNTAQVLWARSDADAERWEQVHRRLMQRRCDPTVVRLIQALVVELARAQVELAGAHAERDAWTDALQALRLATNLVGESILASDSGVRGAKRRPELIAQAGRDDVAAIITATVTVRRPTPDELRGLAYQRIAFRARAERYILDLYEQSSSPEANTIARSWRLRGGSSGDYYAALVQDGFGAGMVNYLRVLSGVPRLPAAALRLSGKEVQAPISEWLSLAPTDIASRWQALMGFSEDAAQLLPDLLSRVAEIVLVD